ncbi:MAG: LamG domain-containing protein [Candidatus Brocadiales bacterium]|nr:LamG domain-containing protein [Candidatus Brocadiales bacterium]
MKFDKFNFKFFKSWGVLVFTFLVVFRVVLWLSIEWPDCNGAPVDQADKVVKIHNLPVRFMVYWPDSARYWITGQNAPDLEYFLTSVFFGLVRTIKDHIAYGVLALNILSFITAWILYLMLRARGSTFAAIVVFISFSNLFTISMEYAILRDILARFFLVLSIYLIWRVCISPNWGLVWLTCVVLFFLGWTRQELMLVPLIVIPVLLRELLVRYIAVFLIVGLLGVYTHTHVNNNSGIWLYSQLQDNLLTEKSTFVLDMPSSRLYSQLQDNLLTESYNYNSPDLGDLPREIYSEAKRIESIFKVDCALPSIRFGCFVLERDRVIKRWREENKGNLAIPDKNKMLFLDILKYNTKYIIYSSAYSLWAYFTGQLFTISPFVYDGDNPQYKFGWPSYASTSVTVYNDPLSELSLDERGPRWLLVIMAPFSEYWYRKICAPFFFIGLYYIGRMFFLGQDKTSLEEKMFWLLAMLLLIAILLIFCFVGVRTSRIIFSVDPLMFAVSILGMQATGRVLLEYWIIRVYPWFKSLCLLIQYAIIGTIIITSLISISILKNYTSSTSDTYAVWNMDADKKDKIADSRGRYSATSFNTEIVEGHSGKARYFNGKDSYIQTPVNVQGWKGLTISLWVKPERKEGDELSVILDNGHNAENNFVIQSADASGGKWVWHCNGVDIFLDIPLNQWSNVVVVADGEKGIVRAYTSGSKVTEVRVDEGFEFGPTPLTIGKLAKADARYFKGSIDEVIIWNTVLDVE